MTARQAKRPPYNRVGTPRCGVRLLARYQCRLDSVSPYQFSGTDDAVFWRQLMETPLQILSVDDEPSITLSMRFVFDDARYQLTCVNSGNAALARLDANSDLFDVIIVDEKMPNLTGLELVRAIRKRGIQGRIIVVSANLSSELTQAYAQMDVHAIFSKPFNVDELRSTVDRLAA